MVFTRYLLALTACTLLAQAFPQSPAHAKNPFRGMMKRDETWPGEGYCVCIEYFKSKGGVDQNEPISQTNVDETLTQDICNHQYGSPAHYAAGSKESEHYACFSPEFGRDSLTAFDSYCAHSSEQPCKYFGVCCDPNDACLKEYDPDCAA